MTTAAGLRGHVAGVTSYGEGTYTQYIYSLVRDKKYAQVVKLLTSELSWTLNERASLSLLAFCQYELQDFVGAVETYQTLATQWPTVPEYQLYYAQTLVKTEQYPMAQKVCQRLADHPQFMRQVSQLQIIINYETDELEVCRHIINKTAPAATPTTPGTLPPPNPELLTNQACIAYKEGKYEESCQKYAEATKILGFQPALGFNTALCHYRLKQYVSALKCLTEVIERGIQAHPDLGVGTASQGGIVPSVGNSQTLHDSYLVECFNLKAAIEYQLKNKDAAKEALLDMPPRREDELDPVTLHNHALMNMDSDPNGGFEKLHFLLSDVPKLEETLENLLLLYVKYESYDAAADLLAQFTQPGMNVVSPFTRDMVEAAIAAHGGGSKEAAFKKLSELGAQQTDELKKLTRQIQDARAQYEDDQLKRLVTEYDVAIQRYVPILMAQSKIYWDMGNYAAVERLFRKSLDLLSDNETWRLNVAHVLFMQDNKYKECIEFYEPFVSKASGQLLEVPAIVLANLCVAYIITSQNELAEDIMREVETEELAAQQANPKQKHYHLCMINLVIGTLYCSKNNYEFGIGRIIRSMEPFDQKLGPDTWFYAKRCILALLEALSKQLLILPDETWTDVLHFLDECETHGRAMSATMDSAWSTSMTQLEASLGIAASCGFLAASSNHDVQAGKRRGSRAVGDGGDANVDDDDDDSGGDGGGREAVDGRGGGGAGSGRGGRGGDRDRAGHAGADGADDTDDPAAVAKATIAFQARMLKSLFLRLMG